MYNGAVTPRRTRPTDELLTFWCGRPLKKKLEMSVQNMAFWFKTDQKTDVLRTYCRRVGDVLRIYKTTTLISSDYMLIMCACAK